MIGPCNQAIGIRWLDYLAWCWHDSIEPLGLSTHHKLMELAKKFQRPTQPLLKREFQPREEETREEKNRERREREKEKGRRKKARKFVQAEILQVFKICKVLKVSMCFHKLIYLA